VRKISALFNVTRVYNAIAAVAGMRRALALAQDYAARRTAFGKRLIEQPLHAETLADLDARFRACFFLTFQVVELMGREECDEASEGELAMLRLLTPVAKLYTAKQAVTIASEALEAFGGAGYIEDTGLPRLLRDAQVLPIWEGTTNVLSLDVWRAIARTDALAPWVGDVRACMSCVKLPRLTPAVDHVLRAVEGIERYVARTQDDAARERGARRLAFTIARTAAAARMIEHGAWGAARDDADRGAVDATLRWTTKGLARDLDAAPAPDRR